jgi:hypothetical protein
MNRRAGVTLLEVLIAIFVVALGLLALLTLFPLGALSMAQALKDDRVAQTSANAVSTLKALNVLTDSGITTAMTSNVNQGDGPSYPVFFDPIGYKLYPGLAQTHIAGQMTGITRSSCQYLTGLGQNPSLISAWFTSLDDMGFTNDGSQLGLPADDSGQPSATTGNPVQRVGGYSWGAMLRRPHAFENLTEVSIVVYGGRSTDLTASLAPAGETTLNVTAVPANNVITVSFNGPAPDIRAGAWILDGTSGVGHGDFYRVTNVTVNGSTADLELQTPLKFVPGQVVLMDNVAEVIYKGVIAP